MNNWSTNPGQDSNRRRSHRVLLNVPITVSCETPQGVFTEKTQTLVVNAHGALITLGAKVTAGQTLLIKQRFRGFACLPRRLCRPRDARANTIWH